MPVFVADGHRKLTQSSDEESFRDAADIFFKRVGIGNEASGQGGADHGYNDPEAMNSTDDQGRGSADCY